MLPAAAAAAAVVRRLSMTSVRRDAKRTITHLVTGCSVPGDESDCRRATIELRRRLIIIATAVYDYCWLGIGRRRTADRKSNSIKQPQLHSATRTASSDRLRAI